MRWRRLSISFLLAGVSLAVGFVMLVAAGGARAESPPLEGTDPTLSAQDLGYTFVTTVTAPGGGKDAKFGWVVAADEDTLVVGAPGPYPYSASITGSAHVFYRNQGGLDAWGHAADLDAGAVFPSHYFGWSVAVDGDTAVVGAYGVTGGQTPGGAAYVFERDQGGSDQWGVVKTLVYSDAASGDNCGWAVGVDGDTAVVSARKKGSGAAYVFYRDRGGADNWGEVAKMVEPDAADVNDEFGRAVALRGDTIVVGAGYAKVGAEWDRGRAFVFSRDQGGNDNWGLTKELTPVISVGDNPGMFGCSVAIDGGDALVGAWGTDVSPALDWGAAYLFRQDQGGTGNWGQVQVLTSLTGTAYQRAGFSVVIDQQRYLAAAYQADVRATNGGAVFEFVDTGGGVFSWTGTISAADGVENDVFGYYMAATSGTLFISTPAKTVDGNTNQGVAYVFSTNGHTPVYTMALQLPVAIKD